MIFFAISPALHQAECGASVAVFAVQNSCWHYGWIDPRKQANLLVGLVPFTKVRRAQYIPHKPVKQRLNQNLCHELHEFARIFKSLTLRNATLSNLTAKSAKRTTFYDFLCDLTCTAQAQCGANVAVFAVQNSCLTLIW